MPGQINLDSEFGKIIHEYSCSKEYKSYMEIGTWNGQGSTRCFIDGLLTRDDDYSFITLEACPDFYSEASSFNRDVLSDKIQILHGRIVDDEDLTITDLTLQEQSWLVGDKNNYKTCINIWDSIPHSYDVVLLDGGEFSTLAEFNKLKGGASVLLLDDTKCMKNRSVLQELNLDNDWELVMSSDDRHGFAVYRRKEHV